MPHISRIQISSYFYNIIFSKVILKGKKIGKRVRAPGEGERGNYGLKLV
jgi:hypothetical protein